MVVILGILACLFGHLFHSQVKASLTYIFNLPNLSLLVNGRIDWGYANLFWCHHGIFSYYFWLNPCFHCHHFKNFYQIEWPWTLNLHRDLRYIHFFYTDPKGAIMETRTLRPYFCLLPYYFGSIFYMYILVFLYLIVIFLFSYCNIILILRFYLAK